MSNRLRPTLIALFLTSILFSRHSMSEEITPALIEKYRHGATAAEIELALKSAPQNPAQRQAFAPPAWQPAADTADFKYVLLSSEAGFSEAQNLRYAIAQNLPEGVKLVLLVQQNQAQKILQEYSKYISADRLILARDQNIDGGFWARDAFPYPVVNEKNELSLVSAKYYRYFKSSPAVASSLALNMNKQNFTFVGGNLIADEFGTCFTVDSYRKFTTTTEHLYDVYGCKQVHVLKHYAGIGDVDEVMKPIGNKTILTNTTEYVQDFKSWGYNVVMLPKLAGYRTYANSLVVGKTVFMPAYGVPQDTDAQKVYESLGYKVVQIKSNTLSDSMHGSVHCQTMAYPAVNEEKLLQSLQLERIN